MEVARIISDHGVIAPIRAVSGPRSDRSITKTALNHHVSPGCTHDGLPTVSDDIGCTMREFTVFAAWPSETIHETDFVDYRGYRKPI
jgi:hypothetical protein